MSPLRSKVVSIDLVPFSQDASVWGDHGGCAYSSKSPLQNTCPELNLKLFQLCLELVLAPSGLTGFEFPGPESTNQGISFVMLERQKHM